MAAKIVRLGSEAVAPLAQGVDIAADLVATTLGPAGRAVLVGRSHAAPLMLRKGYAVMQNLDLADSGLQAGVLAMRDLAWRTTDEVGDGTSTAIVMARAFLRAGQRAVLAGVSPAELQEVIDAHRRRVVAELEAASRPVASEAELARIATQAAGGDQAIGKLMAGAHIQAGLDGLVIVEEGNEAADHVQGETGLHFDQGWLSPYFADPETQRVEIDDPLILLHLGPINDLGSIMPALQMIAKADRGLVLIAESVGGDALSTLIVNKQRAGFKVAAVKAPGVGPWRQLMLEDIAVATGGMVIAEQLGTSLEHLRPQMAGRAQKVRITRADTTIIGGRGSAEALEGRAREIRDAITRERHLSFDREQHCKRLARLKAGIANSAGRRHHRDGDLAAAGSRQGSVGSRARGTGGWRSPRRSGGARSRRQARRAVPAGGPCRPPRRAGVRRGSWRPASGDRRQCRRRRKVRGPPPGERRQGDLLRCRDSALRGARRASRPSCRAEGCARQQRVARQPPAQRRRLARAGRSCCGEKLGAAARSVITIVWRGRSRRSTLAAHTTLSASFGTGTSLARALLRDHNTDDVERC